MTSQGSGAWIDAMRVGRDGEGSDEAEGHGGGSGACPLALVLSRVRSGLAVMGREP
jgi:hypothetical protein